MSLVNWLQVLQPLISGRRSSRSRVTRPLLVEPLEDRTLLSGYTFKKIADTNGSFSNLRGATLNNSGTVAFVADLASGGDGLFTSNGGAITNIVTADSPFGSFLGWSINDQGNVAFALQDSGFFISMDGAISPVLGQIGDDQVLAATGSLGSMNNLGEIAFTGLVTVSRPDGSSEQITGVFRSNGVVTQVVATNSSFGAYSYINEGGAVVFEETRYSDNFFGLFKSSAGSMTSIVNNEGEFRGALSPFGINDLGMTAFAADLDSEEHGIFLANPGGAISTVALGPYSNPSVNNNGELVFQHFFDILSSKGGTLTSVVQGGDFGGFLPSSFGLISNESLNDRGQIVFLAYASDGSAAIFRADPVTLVVTTQPPSSVPAGEPFAVTISANDVNGSLDANFNGSVTLALANNPGGSTLGGTVTVNAVNGVAHFKNLTLNNFGVGYTLQATSADPLPATTNPFDVTLDLAPIVLAWNNTLGGLDYSYQISANLPSDTTIAFYWASGTTVNTILGNSFYSAPTGMAKGSHGPSHVPGSAITVPPPGAKYILAVTDPDSLIAESNEANNVQYLFVPNVSADKISWNDESAELSKIDTSQRKRLNYTMSIVADGNLPDPVRGQFHWSNYTLDDSPITAANWMQFVVGAALRQVNLDQTQGIFDHAEPAYNWGTPPAEATGILLVLDPGDNLIEFNENDNFVFLSMHTASEILRFEGYNAVTFAQVGAAAITASFKPGGGAMTLAEAETRFGVDHFNWIQWVNVPENWQPVTLGGLDYGRWLDDGLIVTGEGLVAYADNGVPLASQYAIERTFLDPIVQAQPGQTVTSVTRAFIITQSDGTRRVMVWPNDDSANISLAIEDRQQLRDAPQPDAYWYYHREGDNQSWGGVHTPANADAYTLRFGDAPRQLVWAFGSSERPWLAFSTHLVGVKVGRDSWISFLGIDPTIPTGFTWSSDRTVAETGGIREIAYAGGNPNRTLGDEQGGILTIDPATSFPSYAPPTSSVAPLPAKSFPQFEVSWTGTADPATGGIAVYSVFFSDNNGPFQPLIENTTATSSQFTGQHGHTYTFYSVATDMFGQVQPTPMTPQATTVHIAPVQPTAAVALPAISRTNASPTGTAVAAMLAGAANGDGSPPAGIAVIGSTGIGVWQYSASNGGTWTSFGSLSAAAVRLLRRTDLVRFVPKSTFTGVATLSYRAWDWTTGTAGATVNLSAASAVGATTAYSSGVRQAAVRVGVARLVRLGFATQPPATAKLKKVMPVVRVQLLDQYGQPFKKTNQLITITLVVGKVKVIYQAYTNVNGVAVFRAIVPPRRGAAKLIAASTGLLKALSNPFQVV